MRFVRCTQGGLVAVAGLMILLLAVGIPVALTLKAPKSTDGLMYEGPSLSSGYRVVEWLRQRISIPAVLGQLLVGVVIGPSLFGWVHPGLALDTFSNLGVLLGREGENSFSVKRHFIVDFVPVL
jgi:hypothetical protein